MIAAAKYIKSPKFLGEYNSLWEKYKKFTGYSITGKVGNITYEVCETPEIMFLDDATDCCQGFSKAGEICMIRGRVQRVFG